MVKNILFDDLDDEEQVLSNKKQEVEQKEEKPNYLSSLSDETKFELEKLLVNKLGDNIQIDIEGNSIKVSEKPDSKWEEPKTISTEQTIDLMYSTIVLLVQEIQDLRQYVISLTLDNEKLNKNLRQDMNDLYTNLKRDIEKLYLNTEEKKSFVKKFFNK